MTSIIFLIGTYDAKLFGFKLDFDETDPSKLIKPHLFTEDHAGCIRSIATGKVGPITMAATGASDSHMYLYNVSYSKSYGVVDQGDYVTSIEFIPSKQSYFLTGCEDGNIRLYRTKDFTPMLVMKGHRAPVTGLSAHPSGRMALSTGKDKRLRLWNLMSGKQEIQTLLEEECFFLSWNKFDDVSDLNSHFLLLFQHSVHIHSPQASSIRTPESVFSPTYSVFNEGQEYKCSHHLTSVCWCFDGHICVGGEEGDIWIVNVKSIKSPKPKSKKEFSKQKGGGKDVGKRRHIDADKSNPISLESCYHSRIFTGKGGRVKGIHCVSLPSDKHSGYLCLASSSGILVILKITIEKSTVNIVEIGRKELDIRVVTSSAGLFEDKTKK
ncbi:hypothetical protein ADUPG1_009764 [Aduncisulcus paluster]|uniref:Uncharacterized protein n=1 Tax=Aduncisulcus paluster TaxID=2918883 RepID=A0ABQ5KWS1_9EUKA|nr:hypothetical protein ADUPG1_009764 [Aduncisulcus paluster]